MTRFSVSLLLAPLVLGFLSALHAADRSTPDGKECLLKNGLAYAPFRDGQYPGAVPPKEPTKSQGSEDMQFLANITKKLRTYGASGMQLEIAIIANKFGVHIAQGVYLDNEEDANNEEIRQAVKLAEAGTVDTIIVGNEVLTGKKLPKAELLRYLKKVRALAPKKTRITTAETWDKWVANPEIANEVDIVFAHFYPFWEGIGIDGAMTSLWAHFAKLEQVLAKHVPKKKLNIVIAETGWPSAGVPRGAAIPSVANHAKYFRDFTNSACQRGIEFYYFSAFDEEWKWREGASAGAFDSDLPLERNFAGRMHGSSWGLFSSSGMLKEGLTGTVDQPSPGSRREREVTVGGSLRQYYSIGIDTSEGRRDWLDVRDAELVLSYPKNQKWAAAFVTVGKPAKRIPRPFKDFSGFEYLAFEVRGANGKEVVDVGLKGNQAPSDGTEKTIPIKDIRTEYTLKTIPLRDFESRVFRYPDDLKELNVVAEFVYRGEASQKVFVRNIRFLPKRESVEVGR